MIQITYIYMCIMYYSKNQVSSTDQYLCMFEIHILCISFLFLTLPT